MSKYFNTEGPCVVGEHYMLPPQGRLQGLKAIIDAKRYFVIHAARQSGKTTLLHDLWKELNNAGDYYCLYCSLETLDSIHDTNTGVRYILNSLASELKFDPYFPADIFPQDLDLTRTNTVLGDALRMICNQLDRPLVILFDEVDCLSEEVLISFLRQVRLGYVNRSRMPFVHSLALVGMRNIRDFQGKIRGDLETLKSASPFNIVTRAKTLRNFTQIEIMQLLKQHGDATGQQFSEAVVQTIFVNTQGQPWLVNAIAQEVVERLLPEEESRIQQEHVEKAIQTIIQNRDTHVESLLKHLREKRVQRIIEPLILGESINRDPLNDDYSFVLDLGLIRVDEQKKVVPANPIYAEVMLRVLSDSAQNSMIENDYPPDATA